jgi:hypothetical protein
MADKNEGRSFEEQGYEVDEASGIVTVAVESPSDEQRIQTYETWRRMGGEALKFYEDLIAKVEAEETASK